MPTPKRRRLNSGEGIPKNTPVDHKDKKNAVQEADIIDIYQRIFEQGRFPKLSTYLGPE